MNAEFDVMVKKVNFSSPENMQKPFDSACYSDRGAYIDMDLIMPDGVLHLCGKNDWGCLIADALVPLLQYAHGVEERIRLEYDSQPEKPDVICLAKTNSGLLIFYIGFVALESHWRCTEEFRL